MQTANTVAANAIYLPPLVVSVFALEPLPVSISSGQEQTSTRTTVSTFAQQLIQSVDVEECVYKAKGVSRPGYGVQLQSDQFMCVSCIHPRVTQSWCLSQQVGEGTLLPAQTCLLNKEKTNLLFLAPSMQVKVLFCSPPAKSNNKQESDTSSNDVRSHLFTASLPLKHVLEQFMRNDSIVHEIITSEDGNKVWQMKLSIADTQPHERENRNANFSSQLDIVLAHEAWVRSQLGYCETLSETATAVTKARQVRKDACFAVLKQLSQCDLPTTWDLQMSRPLNTAATPQGPQPMKLDQQAMEHLRIGCASGDQAQQTFLTFVNALASATVHIAQRADVCIGYNPSTQLAVFDEVAFHHANTEFVAAYGADALMGHMQLKCQELIVSDTIYKSDPAYNTALKMQDPQIDAKGSGHINFTSIVLKSKFPGEDQRISIGYGPEDRGRLPGDCEDFGNGNGSMSSQMLAFNEADFMQSVEHAITFFPPSVQQISHTIVNQAQVLHRNENANMHSLRPSAYVSLQHLDHDVLCKAVQEARKQASVRVVSTCSLLAKAAQIANNNSLSSSRDKTLSAMDLTAATFFNWWGSTRDNGLNGHSVCVGMKYTPVLSTKANNTPVTVTLVSHDPFIVEGTGVARETPTPASLIATLNVTHNQCSQQRLVLQQKLDNGIVLNSPMASNIKSSLHAAEMTERMTPNVPLNNTTAWPASMLPFKQNIDVPSVSAIQSFSLNGEAAKTTAEREVMVNTMFYAVGLACGLGPLYTLDMNSRQHMMDTSSDQHSQANFFGWLHSQEIPRPPQNIFPGTSFMRGLLPEETTARIVVAAQCSEDEKQRLRTLGAFMGLNKLDAESYLKLAPATFMPLHLRQSMSMCPTRNCLTPLSALQLHSTASFSCGVFAKKPFLTPVNGSRYTSTKEIEANMHAIYTNTCNVIGCLPVITGTGVSDSMMIVYP